MITILCSGHMDLYDLHFALWSHGPILHVNSQHRGTLDFELFLHFALRPHGPVLSPFYAQVT